MARKSSTTKTRKFPDMDDGVLDSDSEVDEFTNYKATTARPASDDDDDEDGDEEAFDDGFDDDSEEETGDGVGMYEPDEWDGASVTDSDEESDDDAAKMKKLKKGLGDIPLETLRKASGIKGKSTGKGKAKKAESESEDEDTEGMSEKERKVAAMKKRLAQMQRAKGKAANVASDSEDDGYPPGTRRERERDDEREARQLKKRENKHAPTVMSTKKQVTRRRQVIDVPTVERRDPRFSSLSAGKVDADLHARGYDFLPGMQKDEVYNLKNAVTVAMKAERTCKLVEKPRFTAERERLEKELARARSKWERTKRETREREVLAKAKREEREKRADGKGAWYMKESEKKDLLLQARFASLEAEGGKRAVKKVMDKKMKKVAGKEKKSRPFAAGGGAGMEGDRKRRRVA